MKYSKMKKDAIKAFNKNNRPFVLAMLVLMAVFLVCLLIGYAAYTRWVSWLFMLVCSSLLVMGLIRMAIKASNNKKVSLDDLTCETNLFLKYIGIVIVVGTIVGIMLLLAAISFKSLLVVLSNIETFNMAISVFLVALGILITSFVIMTAIYMFMAFSQSLFILYEEKKLSVLQVLSKSFNMMEDYMADYFVLTLSFVGWILLGIMTVGLAFIWILPYMLITYAYFYKKVKKEYEAGNGDEIEEIFNDDDVEETLE